MKDSQQEIRKEDVITQTKALLESIVEALRLSAQNKHHYANKDPEEHPGIHDVSAQVRERISQFHFVGEDTKPTAAEEAIKTKAMIQKLLNDIDSAFQKRPNTRELDVFHKVRSDLERGVEYMEYGAKIDILGDPVQNEMFVKTLQMGTSIAKMVHLSNFWEAGAAPPIDAKFQPKHYSM